MKTFIIEYELPPLRAIYTCECDANTEVHARLAFEKQKTHPDQRIRKIYEKEKAEDSLGQCGEKGGYLCDVHGNTGHVGDKHRAPTGDKGQRYMVVATFGGIEKPVGWASTIKGANEMLDGAKKWPACKNPRVIDRQL